MAINSAQGIASLYRGNPQPLQQSIQKEQQAKPGFAPDMLKMLALQIVNNEKDAAAAQAAMQQLKQMSGPTGQMPTVMASLEQQAKQKIQAQQQQARQQAEQRGLPAGLMGVQGEPPQPEAQPEAQGIDQLPAEFEMARGGIVAFDSGGEVDAAKEEAREAMARLQSYGLAQRKNDPEGFEAAQARAAEAKQKLMVAQSTYAQEMSAAGMDRPVQVTGMPKPRPPEPERGLSAAVQQAPVASQQAPAAPPPERVSPAQVERAAPPAPPPIRREAAPTQERQSTVGDIAALAKQMQDSVTPTAPAAVSSVPKQMLTDRMNFDPEAEEAKAIAKRKAALPQEDLSQHDRLLAELEKRKQSLEPKKGYEGLMEFLGQVSANSQPGRGSFASGAAGSRALDALNRERATQQFELSKQQIEVSQKKLDSVRKYAEDNYNVGKAKFDQVYRDKYDAAKELLNDENEAAQQAKQETLKYFELAQNRILEQQKIRAQAANRPFDVQGELAKAVLAGDKPRADKLREILSTVGEAKRPGADTAQVEKFEKGNVIDMMTMKNLQGKAKLTAEERQKLQNLQQSLASKAKAQGIDPAQIGIMGATPASAGGIDLSKWGELKKN
jgi:hypothetical protein